MRSAISPAGFIFTHRDISHNQFVIVRSERLLAEIRIGLDRTIQYFIDSPIKSGNDIVVDL